MLEADDEVLVGGLELLQALDEAGPGRTAVREEEARPVRQLEVCPGGGISVIGADRQAGEQEAEEIRRRLTLSLDQESTRLRSARAEFVLVRTELVTLTGGSFARGLQIGEEESGVGTVPVPSTSVLGTAQGGAGGVAGAAGLPPVAPISVSMPHLTGLTAAGLAPIIATASSRNSKPVWPEMNITGTNTAHTTNVIEMTANPTCRAPL